MTDDVQAVESGGVVSSAGQGGVEVGDASASKVESHPQQDIGQSVADVVREKISASSKRAGKKAAEKEVSEPLPTGAEPTEVYTPNFKYKAAGQEKEIDQFWRQFIKDAETEKRIKDVLSKVDAFDVMKERREHFEKQYSALSGEYENLSNVVDRFDRSVQAGDLTTAFKIANIPKEAVYRWVAEQLKYDELPAEQRRQLEQAEAARLQQFEYEDKIARMEKQYRDQAVQTRTMQLDMVLMRPEVASFAQAWDQNAEPGFTFRDTVAAEARRVFFETGQDLSPEQAVAMVMNRFGRFINASQAAPTQQVATQSPQVASQTVVPQRPAQPTIPNVSGKAASPIKKAFKSLDELRAYEKTLS